MTNKEKEKLYYNVIKQESKNFSWKFKSYFTFKVVDNLYFVANFYVVPKTNNIYGWLAFKPYCLDDLFWEITDSIENSKLPLSFRGEAAFQVTADSIYEFDITIINEEIPNAEINQLLTNIENEIEKHKKEYPTVETFLEKQLANENIHSVRILTSLINLEKYEEAESKIKEYRKNDISSGYGFGKKDYYDLAEEFCKKKNKKNESFLKRIFKR